MFDFLNSDLSNNHEKLCMKSLIRVCEQLNEAVLKILDVETREKSLFN